MSIKKYVKERQAKRNLLNNLKKIIIDKPGEELKTFEALNIDSTHDVMRHFINIGNMSYYCGDNDIFEYFIESLFDIINAEPIGFDSEELIKRLYHYGLMSAHSYDIISYSVILNHIKKDILKLSEAQSVNHYLKILKELALLSVSNDFAAGIMETLHAFKEINSYFRDRKMQINGLYLKNTLISIIYSAEKSRHENIKNIMQAEASEILGFSSQEDQIDILYDGTEPAIEEAEESPQQAT